MQAFRPAVTACAALVALTAATGLAAMQQPGASAGDRPFSSQACAAVRRATGLPNPTTVIIAAMFNPASAAQPAPNPQAPPTPALPEHCEVVGKMNERTGMQFVRLFAVPGMNHCAGGPSTDQFDAFGALVNWVEKGSAPDRIVATARMTTPWPGRTRPLCAYPQQARYTGSGSVEEAGNFVCR